MIALVLAAALAAAGPPAPAPLSAQPPTTEEPAVPPQVPPDSGGEVWVMRDFETAQALRGPLEGRWKLIRTDGRPLYFFQIADAGGKPDPRAAQPDAPDIEGAWLDIARSRTAAGAGYLASVRVRQARLVILFYELRRAANTLTLSDAGPGVWTGVLDGPDGAIQVILRKD
jgi:hypothetical protein